MECLWLCPYVLDNGHWMDPAEWRVAVSTVSPMAIIWCNRHLEEIPPHEEELHRQFGRSLHVLYPFERAADPKNLRVKGRISPLWQLDWVCHLARSNRFSRHLTQQFLTGKGLNIPQYIIISEIWKAYPNKNGFMIKSQLCYQKIRSVHMQWRGFRALKKTLLMRV
jgi:hypothetical protein